MERNDTLSLAMIFKKHKHFKINQSNNIDQFYRVEKSRSIKHGGSGLGLAIVKRIVELHGGNVKLESEKGSWTSVMVFLPVTGNNVKK